MLTSHERIARQKKHPRLVELHRALTRLNSTLVVMNTGAHPDDEQSSMLAAMRFGAGMHVVILCSTRGEGGQNSIGPERTSALGVVRTRELEEAARELDADIAWIGYGPQDPVHDFGFSKSGADTLSRWGRDIVLERMVRAYRQHRPDIVIPTFLDVPGQHGHHRAMTEAAETAIALAADSNAYPEHLREGLKPWKVTKYYLPGWSGGGGTYDDEVAPPNATVNFTMSGRDEATGASWIDLGEWSRAGHASQGMGHWRVEDRHEWPLHLKIGPKGPETSIDHNLPATLAALGKAIGGASVAQLVAAQAEIEAAQAAFPHAEPIIKRLASAAALIEEARSGLTADEADEFGHRLERKLNELDAALLITAGITATAWAEPAAMSPGSNGTLNVRLVSDRAVKLEPVVTGAFRLGDASVAGPLTTYPLSVAANAPLSDPYTSGFATIGGNGPVSLRMSTEIGRRIVSVPLDLEENVQIVPAHSVRLDPNALILSRNALPEAVQVAARVEGPAGSISIEESDEIRIDGTDSGFVVAPGQLAVGVHRLPALIDGSPAFRQTSIAYPHIGRTFHIEPEVLSVLALDLKLPEGAVIGYAGGGSDRVGIWMRRMGLGVIDLSPEHLAGDLQPFATIVVGTFAYGLRPDLFAARDRINAWVEAGGNLVTLYHRPTDGWEPQRTPPRRLVIGSPSLRWRVTDPAAAVDVLEPGHALLAGPNAIGDGDFAGWDKERGLYFASEWDAAYRPLLAMHDPGEAPLEGSLLSARIGRGRHTHTSLVLHHQMDKLVPGAFRLMANLVQPA